MADIPRGAQPLVRALRIVCPTCHAPIGEHCRRPKRHGRIPHHAERVIAGDRAVAEARRGTRFHVSTSAAVHVEIQAEAKARGVSMSKVAEDRIVGHLDRLRAQ